MALPINDFVMLPERKRPIILCKKGLNNTDTPLPLIDNKTRNPGFTAVCQGAAFAVGISGAFIGVPAQAAGLLGMAPLPLSTALLLGMGALAVALAAVGLFALRQRARRVEASDFLRVAFETMAHGAIVYDANQRVAAFNQRYIEMLGMPPGAVFVGQTLANILRIQKNLGIHTDLDIEDFIARRYDEIRHGVARRMEVHMPDGRTLVLRTGAVPGRLHVSSFVDITERKRLEHLREESEERRRAAAVMLDLTFENMAQGAIVFDSEMRIVAFNRRYLELFDLPPEVVFVGQDLADVLRARYARGHYPGVNDIEAYIVAVYDDLRRGDTKTQDYDLPSGRTVAMRSVSLDRGLHIATFTDITVRRHAQLALKESEGRIRAILEHAADAIMTIAPDGTVMSVNPATLRIFGYTENEIVGRNVHMLVPQGDIRSPDGAPSVSGDGKGRRKDGTLFLLEMSCARTHLGESEVGILILRDVTAQKDMQAQLMHTSKLATVGQMAAGLAHEMNQPLNVVRMAADNVLIRMDRGEVDPEYLREKLELIGDQTEKVGKMILHMRVFARSDAPDFTPFNPVESVRSAARLMEHRLTFANIRLDVDLPERCPAVLGHASQLEQVIINLLANSCDAVTDHPNAFGTSIGRVAVSVCEDATKGAVVIRVNDTGGGIPADIRDRIFDPFFTTKDVGKGTGLGLSICSTIIAEMRGRIEIVDAAFGTEIIVTIPAYTADIGSSAAIEEQAS
jgi:PAS domain S-box-containing protein